MLYTAERLTLAQLLDKKQPHLHTNAARIVNKGRPDRFLLLVHKPWQR